MAAEPRKPITSPSQTALGQEIEVELVKDAGAFASWRPLLDELAGLTAEENIFYEPWMLLPALDSYGVDRNAVVFLMVTTSVQGSGHRLLCGFFPLEVRTKYRGMPMANIALWRYPHCYLTTPLIHRQFIGESLSALVAWFQDEKCYQLMSMNDLSASGGLFRQITAALESAPSLFILRQPHERAFHHVNQEGAAHPTGGFSPKARRECQRLHRRLSECGQLRWDELNPAGEIGTWVDEFLTLEESGWKGRSGTALGSSKEGTAFFHRIAGAAFSRGSLLMLALRLDDQPIAMIAVLLDRNKGYAFKMAFDENYRRFSPGAQLLIELNRRLSVREGFVSLDSCAAPDNTLANRMWPDRKPLCNLIAARSDTFGSAFLHLLPSLSRMRKRIGQPGHSQ